MYIAHCHLKLHDRLSNASRSGFLPFIELEPGQPLKRRGHRRHNQFSCLGVLVVTIIVLLECNLNGRETLIKSGGERHYFIT